MILQTRRILGNLPSAGVRKEGASFDLPIALGVLCASDQLPGQMLEKTMILGELNLAGEVRPVRGVLSAVGVGIKQGITTFVVPEENRFEAEALGKGEVAGVTSLADAVYALTALYHGKYQNCNSH